MSKDIESTLNYLEEKNNLKNRCPYELIDAKRKLIFYDAIYLISIDKRKKALKKLRTIVFNGIPYIALFIFLWVRIPSKILLKLLRR